MSREIEFRVWNTDFTEDEGGGYYMDYDIAFEDYAPINDLLCGVNNLMQYTGLKDKNGKKIFEGDIVNCVPYKKHLKDSCMHGIREVVFDQPSATFYYDPYIVMNWGGIAHYEIIGNIHENAELLNN